MLLHETNENLDIGPSFLYLNQKFRALRHERGPHNMPTIRNDLSFVDIHPSDSWGHFRFKTIY